MWGALSYLFVAIASATVCAVLLRKSRDGGIIRRAVVAAAIPVVGALVLSGQARRGVQAAWVTLLVEALRYGGWFVLLRALAPASTPLLKQVSLILVTALCVYALLGWSGQFTGSFALPLERVV